MATLHCSGALVKENVLLSCGKIQTKLHKKVFYDYTIVELTRDVGGYICNDSLDELVGSRDWSYNIVGLFCPDSSIVKEHQILSLVLYLRLVKLTIFVCGGGSNIDGINPQEIIDIGDYTFFELVTILRAMVHTPVRLTPINTSAINLSSSSNIEVGTSVIAKSLQNTQFVNPNTEDYGKYVESAVCFLGYDAKVDKEFPLYTLKVDNSMHEKHDHCYVEWD